MKTTDTGGINAKPSIDLNVTTPVTSSTGGQIFTEGTIIRKISKFVIGSSEDALIPIPVMYDIKTGEILIEMLPKELREEISIYNQNLDK
jgi:hypothetical protein